MESIDVDDFVKQLIVHKCSVLIEKEKMLPETILSIVRTARDEYFKNPSPKNYETMKKLFSQTKYVDDGIDYKNFNRRIVVIGIKFMLNKSKEYFTSHRNVIDMAMKRLDGIDPDLKSSTRAMLQHYNECLSTIDDPVASNEHHLVTFVKEIATKMFIETIDVYSYNKKCTIELNTSSPSSTTVAGSRPLKILKSNDETGKEKINLLANAMNFNRKRKAIHVESKMIKPLFVV
ncbi:hypothetical protein SlsnVgp097 [Spodoptera littoralis nucleopolyhedrovirus]|uniref:Ac106 n=1 Tax=Spodoptera littoralis nuclear polyhedrosis virus TaxID=10456 RepID=M1JSM6_NPVSL|nr:hypothetical protein SlsnVgp097 [Spodoptera littoralis nucleopolyhedrovirus]AGE89952.1 hypothetical protein SlsnVgp097 [Spodoptera littoralis nucleopolyhedrovirus]AYU75286.1 hypothetical protein [Spodoptera littoralis nucleopolyhedrovirus]